MRTKSDPTNYEAVMMRGVPQGARSSPVLFNLYVNRLATDIEATVSARTGDCATVMMADDVLLQTRTQTGLKKALNIPMEWPMESEVSWDEKKFSYIQRVRGRLEVRLNAHILKEVSEATCLGMKM